MSSQIKTEYELYMDNVDMKNKYKKLEQKRKTRENKRYLISFGGHIVEDKYNNIITYLQSLPYTYILSCQEEGDVDNVYYIHNIYIQFENSQILDKELLKNIDKDIDIIEISAQKSSQVIHDIKFGYNAIILLEEGQF